MDDDQVELVDDYGVFRLIEGGADCPTVAKLKANAARNLEKGLRSLIKREPFFVSPRLELARLLCGHGREAESVPYYRRVVFQTRNDPLYADAAPIYMCEFASALIARSGFDLRASQRFGNHPPLSKAAVRDLDVAERILNQARNHYMILEAYLRYIQDIRSILIFYLAQLGLRHVSAGK